MVRVGFDTKLLVYAELEPESDKGLRAFSVLSGSTRDSVIAAQVFGEFLNVVRRKKPDALPAAILQVERYRRVVGTPSTTLDAVKTAIDVAQEQKIQFWDSLICVVTAQAGATILLSEDMQDGMDVRGLKIVNPFDAKNDALVGRLLG
ncbi:MAG: PIN domain-containing protein [Parvularculaceae bacterium]|nr:PIN domain-containing protein [Parvularculaceae bacterium]